MSEQTKEIEVKAPGPGEEGYYSPPTKESVTHQPQLDVQPEEAGESGSDEPVDYSDFTVAELKDMAHKRGVEIHSDMLKDDIIGALQAADKAA